MRKIQLVNNIERKKRLNSRERCSVCEKEPDKLMRLLQPFDPADPEYEGEIDHDWECFCKDCLKEALEMLDG